MRAGVKLEDQALLEQFAAEFTALGERNESIVVSLQPLDAWAVIASVQLALRHPAHTGLMAERARRVIEGLGERLAVTPAMAEVFRRGWDPTHDALSTVEPPRRVDVDRALDEPLLEALSAFLKAVLGHEITREGLRGAALVLSARLRRETVPVATPSKLWVLTIDARGPESGPVVSLHETEGGAHDALYDYVEDRWPWHDRPIPEDRDDAIEEYFDESDDNGWTIRETEVGT